MRRQGKRVRTEHLDVRVLASLSALGGAPPLPQVGAVGDPDAAPHADATHADTTHAAAVDTDAADRPLGRVGIIVPRHRQTAVRRNQLKRRLRELVRRELLPALPTGAVLIRARAEAYEATFAQLARQIARVRRDAARLVGVA